MDFIDVKTVRTEVQRTVCLTAAHIRMLVRDQAPEGMVVPSNARVTVQVPGGGDYANTELDIADVPVIVSWTEVTES